MDAAPRTPPAARRRVTTPGLMPLVAGVVSGAGLAAAAFLPWYAVNIAPPFSAGSVNGWDATVFARLATVLGVVVLLASAARVLGSAGVFRLERSVRVGLGWAALVAAVVALALVGFRLVVLPDPADLLSRQVGLYAAAVAAVAAVLSAIGQLAGEG